jgi:hypothetical protein
MGIPAKVIPRGKTEPVSSGRVEPLGPAGVVGMARQPEKWSQKLASELGEILERSLAVKELHLAKLLANDRQLGEM